MDSIRRIFGRVKQLGNVGFDGLITIQYLKKRFEGNTPNVYTTLYDELFHRLPASAAEMADYLHLSPRTCQRDFKKHIGITPLELIKRSQ